MISTIGQIAEILPGYSPRGATEHDPRGTHQVISARHLTAGAPYRFTPDHELRIVPDRVADNYLVKSGDLLFISRGMRNIAVEIEAVPEPTIATATFYLLRINGAVLPGYLAWCINQPPTQATLDFIRTGAGSPMIPRVAFSMIEIPIPSLDEQRSIANLARLQSRERELMKRILEETDTIHRTTGSAILRSFAPPGAKE